MINSDDLRFFHLIANHSSLAATARALNVTPPTVTQRLQTIEQKLKLKLVDRHARKISLTDEGLLLAERARLILAEMDDLYELLNSQQQEIAGRLKILAPLGFGQEYIAPLVTEFQREYNQLSVELELSDNPDWSSGHAWDIMIYIGELRDSSLKLSVLASNRRFLCASPAYIARYGMPETPADLRRHTCIALRENAEDVTMWRFSATDSDEQQAIRINPKLASNDGRVIKQWALAGAGIIQRSEWDVAAQLKSGELIRLLPDYQLPSADIVALLGTDLRARSARTSKFLQLLKARLAGAPWKN
ncbi:LysR family transcriptional regulator [Thalassomonas viridans]|uniref:LysR family transcriptional regulator n=1 Tax=Thalassomonas viridans TaxID=137584 RepID=A0AAF0C9C6_9GAMM|nr:LysR family transcriptional regulator [Thalassomonas viridans]WDE05100.1 LysR family transcriptional regulator [Thalassomonas viridans]